MTTQQTIESFDELFPKGERVSITKICFFMKISRPTATALLKYLYEKGRLSCLSRPGVKGKTYIVS